MTKKKLLLLPTSDRPSLPYAQTRSSNPKCPLFVYASGKKKNE